MNAPPEYLVFSDLDGTLLDHATYDWSPAQPALARLREDGAGLILASSKTGAEISVLRDEMGWSDWPAIVENGSGILPPNGTTMSDLDGTYERLRDVISNLPKGFRGFGDMAVAEIVERTGLSLDNADRARQRQFSEPGVWDGNPEDQDTFIEAAKAMSLSARSGGRFLTLSFGSCKGDRMSEIVNRYNPSFTIALGDAPNDVEMLEAADLGVIVANPDGKPIPRLDGETKGRIIRTKEPGPAGWADAVLRLLADYERTKDVSLHG